VAERVGEEPAPRPPGDFGGSHESRRERDTGHRRVFVVEAIGIMGGTAATEFVRAGGHERKSCAVSGSKKLSA
jgi:hypothetical protein